MKIKFLKDHLGTNKDDVKEMKDDQGRYFIRTGVGEEVSEEKELKTNTETKERKIKTETKAKSKNKKSAFDWLKSKK